MDQNIFNSQKKVDLMVTIFDDQIFVSINGLTFNDYIYSQAVDKSLQNMTLEISSTYT